MVLGRLPADRGALWRTIRGNPCTDGEFWLLRVLAYRQGTCLECDQVIIGQLLFGNGHQFVKLPHGLFFVLPEIDLLIVDRDVSHDSQALEIKQLRGVAQPG
jgi:hypothetical protein